MEWNEMIAGHKSMHEDFMKDEDHREKKAYKQGFHDGCREGWREAMKEVERSFHERRGGTHHMNQRDGYGERNITGNDYSFDPRRDGFGMRGHEEETEHMIHKIAEIVKRELNERKY